VPEVGIEPTLSRGKGDFESPASTSFTTPARGAIIAAQREKSRKMIDNGESAMLKGLPHQQLMNSQCGVVAQLGERLNGIQEVRGSIPLSSTI
jgi:hypothetical protein